MSFLFAPNITLINTANLLVDALTAYGIAPSNFLHQPGVQLGQYTDPNGRVPVALMQRG
ncbi:hypothetical protein [endosymbiont of Ridgeia piscesae]|jgi:hypothetical protein|uniref:Uncharacterized protein n=1 Tax=endosymbiont of Ridgeia piscesae TaxID=54398 RepID=A0A0T5Z9E0_9GAMM|nr:hypothetical protein [endosymbiont of Ridgeia piscesae]KRT55232.1 hypothetical protein Ga0074115_11556 [endosymbiont of Ridgeia piscesae]KRT59508.1 hypothetical protein Ga0076813_155211 [endosymbiont of Ridgeia piscesae]